MLQRNISITICIGLNGLEVFENDKVKVKDFMVQCNVEYAYTKTADFKENHIIWRILWQGNIR